LDLFAVAFVIEIELKYFGDRLADPIISLRVAPISTLARHLAHGMHVRGRDAVERRRIGPLLDHWRLLAIGAFHRHALEPSCLAGRRDVALAEVDAKKPSAILFLDPRADSLLRRHRIADARQPRLIDERGSTARVGG